MSIDGIKAKTAVAPRVYNYIRVKRKRECVIGISAFESTVYIHRHVHTYVHSKRIGTT